MSYVKNGTPGGGGASLSDATPAALGTAAAGVSTSASRADHVHAAPAAGGTYGAGTLAARPGSPAAGDTYAVTSGAATGDRYACYVAGAWTLVAFERDALEDSAVLAWRLDETSGVYVSRGSVACDLTVTGAVVRDVARAPSGRYAFRQPGTTGVYAAGPSGVTGLASGGAVAISAQVRLRAGGGGAYETLVALQFNSAFATPYSSFGLYRATSSSQVRTLLKTTGTGSPQEGFGGGGAVPVDVGRWRLLGVQWNGTSVTHWVDGVQVFSWAPSGGPLLDLGATSRWVVGDLPGATTDHCASDIADVRVYDSARTAAWWQALHARMAGAYGGQ